MAGYQLLRKLADGSAADVFLACEAHSPSRVVLEVIRSELTSDSEVYGRFLDEAKGRQALQHPNLLRHTSTGCAPDGRLYAVTESIDGEHLGSVLKANGPLPAAEVVRLVIPLCSALEYLHARGRVHGHLRPENVFLTRTASGLTPKLLDTGLSLLRPGRSIVVDGSRVLVGAEYLSPERIRGRRASPLSDVYGLGVLMYEALTGAPPFTSSDPASTRRLHLEAEPKALVPQHERLSPIVLRCLAKSPGRRFPDVASVRLALQGYAGLPPPKAVPLPKKRAPDESLEIDLVEEVGEEANADELVVGEPVGEVLGSYELQDLLGQGGMGRVFLARHIKLGRRVALKVLRPELARDPGQLRRFFQEAQAVNRVKNEHIVEIYDFVEEPKAQGGRVYCVMEPLTGKSLKDLAAEGPLPISRTVGILRQTCAALQAAHEVGVVHRDVKPDNIFLIEQRGHRDFVKLLDFGIAKLEAAAGDPASAKTRVGVVFGTPAYMAPEQAAGDRVDARADVYSLGTVLYSLLAGRRPFEADTVRELLTNIVTRPAPPLPKVSQGGEAIPAGLRKLVAACLEKKPADRIPSMAELSAALAPFEARASASVPLQAPAPAPSRSVTPQQPVRRALGGWLLLAAVVIATAVAWAIVWKVSDAPAAQRAAAPSPR